MQEEEREELRVAAASFLLRSSKSAANIRIHVKQRKLASERTKDNDQQEIEVKEEVEAEAKIEEVEEGNVKTVL